MLTGQKLELVREVFKKYPEVVSVYLFGSYLERNEAEVGDIDLAVLFRGWKKSNAEYYMEIYSLLSDIFSPLEVDLLFLHVASLPVRFEVIYTGKIIYCTDEVYRTDFEEITASEYQDFKYHLDMAHQELFELIDEGGSIV